MIPGRGGAGRRRRATWIVRYLVAFLSCVLVVDALVGESGLLAILKARDEGRRLQASLAEIRRENVQLRTEAIRLRDDPAALEDLARRELGLIRPRETVFILVSRR